MSKPEKQPTPQPIPEKQVPDFKRKPERRWELCKQCKEQIFVEANGKTYYHRIDCKRSNGIKYGKDRS